MRASRGGRARDQPVSVDTVVEAINIPATSLLGAVTVEVTYDAAKLTVNSCGPAAANRFDSVVL